MSKKKREKGGEEGDMPEAEAIQSSPPSQGEEPEMPAPVDETSAAEPVAEGKRPHRKPLWLVWPKERHEDGSVRAWSVTKHQTRTEVAKAITNLGFDQTNMPPELMVLRADPIELKISSQIVIKF